MRSSEPFLLELYERLLKAYGPQNWWPVDLEYHRLSGTDPREEIVIGAVLTQNTAWKNVNRAIDNLKREGALSFSSILSMSPERLQKLIKPAGYYRLKAQRLRAVAEFLTPVEKVRTVKREELLGVKGVGKETADAILLYAGDRLYFVIDAYTVRIVERVFGLKGSYDELKSWFEESIPRDLHIYREFHALLDVHAKRICRKVPLCNRCILKNLCLNFTGR